MQDKSIGALLTERAIYISCMWQAEVEEDDPAYRRWWQRVKDIDAELNRRTNQKRMEKG